VPYLNSGAEAGLVALSDWLDTWRGRLTSDTERIEALDASDRFFSDLTWLLVELEDFGDALVASEKGRARAIADIITVGQFENPSDRATLALAPTLEKIQQTAQAHQITLVEYAIMSSEAFEEDALFAWVVEASGDVHFKSTPLGSASRSLKTLIANSRKALGSTLRGGFVLADPQPEAQEMALKELYDILIAPIDEWLPNDDQAPIAVIPQDELFLVPFPALLKEDEQPLIMTHTLFTAPSIQVLELTYQRQSVLQNTDAANDAESLLVGNPTMPPMLDAEGNPKPLLPLPGAENEVKEIARLLGATPLLEAAASETTVKQRIGSAPIIHLATHGLLEYGAEQDDEPPGAIALAPDDTNDGLLTSAEILQLDLTAKLVVLSACDTGLGEITGDGVVGLARSLFSAGTPSVVVSLWGVPDQPTAALMTAFYQQWQDAQHTKAQALREAILETIKNYPEVPDWAAFTLIGTAD
jgi:CHAT domain-containing protein